MRAVCLGGMCNASCRIFFPADMRWVLILLQKCSVPASRKCGAMQCGAAVQKEKQGECGAVRCCARAHLSSGLSKGCTLGLPCCALCAAIHWLHLWERCVSISNGSLIGKLQGALPSYAQCGSLQRTQHIMLPRCGWRHHGRPSAVKKIFPMQRAGSAGSQPGLVPCGAVLCMWWEGTPGPLPSGASIIAEGAARGGSAVPCCAARGFAVPGSTTGNLLGFAGCSCVSSAQALRGGAGTGGFLGGAAWDSPSLGWARGGCGSFGGAGCLGGGGCSGAVRVGGGPGCVSGFGGRGSYSMPLVELELRCARKSRSSDIMPASTACNPGSGCGGASAAGAGCACAGGSAGTGVLPAGMGLPLLAAGGAVPCWPSVRRQKASVALRQVGRCSSACCAAPEMHCNAMKASLCCCADGSCSSPCLNCASVCDKIVRHAASVAWLAASSAGVSDIATC